MSFFEIGKIVNAHGIKGEVKIFPISDDPEKFEKLKSLYISSSSGEREYFIEGYKYHKQFIILKLKGIDDMNAALGFKGSLVKVSRDKGVKLNKDEYYIRDIYDISVYDEEEHFLGTVTDILFTGANDVYEITKEGEKPFLIPAIKQCILNVDIENNKMTVKLLEGLKD
ncbi:MAG: ribosome maturation factor RimM [Lachnospiraceae bacterium]|nr:ribosome maturation factor RimM [Lachnospiraceae bacterium]